MKQAIFQFKKPLAIGRPMAPKGYKGLAGFHKYWGKKPIETWRFLIDNLTTEGEIVLDPFLGSGLIAKECVDSDRRFVGFDINPFCVELTKLYLNLPEYGELKYAIENIKKTIKPEIDRLYQLSSGDIISHILWNGNRITRIWKKERRARIELVLSKKEIIKLENDARRISNPNLKLNLFDNSRINSRSDISVGDLFTSRAISLINNLIESFGGYSNHTTRALRLILTASLGQMSKMVFALTGRGKTKGKETEKIEVGSWVIGYWRPKQHFEINAWNCFENKANKLLKATREVENNAITPESNSFDGFLSGNNPVYLKMGDSEQLLARIPDNTVRLILTDPPHGDRIPYLELSELWNTFLGFDSDFTNELVVSNAKGRDKGISQYNTKLSSIFIECARVLKHNGLLAVIFNSHSSDHWDSLHALEEASGLEYLGCYPMAYSVGSVVQDNRKGGLKTDYVLLYGKNTADSLRNDLSLLSSVIDGWQVEYPKKGK